MSSTHSTTSGDRGHLRAIGGRGRRDGTHKGLSIERVFTQAGEHPFDAVRGSSAARRSQDEGGEVVFEQNDRRDPQDLVAARANVVVSKYFRGHLDASDRERSVKQLIGRVVGQDPRVGRRVGLLRARRTTPQAFADELTHVLVTQRMAFNSPVWFNLGVKDTPQQASACFINSVDDTMESIMDLAKTEAMLFKGGSGTGSNLSKIRSSRERLAGGGTASGPVSFMRGFDAFAGVVKSGGKTRRAAKMVILNVDHPDITRVHPLQGERGEEGLVADRRRLRRRLQRRRAAPTTRSTSRTRTTRCASTDDFMQSAQNGAKWQTRAVTTGETLDTLDAQRGPARDGGRRARLRRSGHPVRHDDQPLEPGQGVGSDQLEQPVLRVHVPRRHGVQPRQPEPDEVRRREDAASTSRRSGARPR